MEIMLMQKKLVGEMSFVYLENNDDTSFMKHRGGYFEMGE